MLGPMILLTISIAIFDEHARLTCLESNALSCHATAIGTAMCRRIVIEIVHGPRFYGAAVSYILIGIRLSHNPKTSEKASSSILAEFRRVSNEDEGACAVPTLDVIEVFFVIIVVI
jgi:hypothetical protein